MKTIILAVVLSLVSTMAMAEPYVPTATVSYSYDTTVPGLVGFKLYHEGVFLCENTDKALTLSCPVPSATAGINNFTLTAYTATSESAQSAPITANYLPPVVIEGMLIIQ